MSKDFVCLFSNIIWEYARKKDMIMCLFKSCKQTFINYAIGAGKHGGSDFFQTTHAGSNIFGLLFVTMVYQKTTFGGYSISVKKIIAIQHFPLICIPFWFPSLDITYPIIVCLQVKVYRINKVCVHIVLQRSMGLQTFPQTNMFPIIQNIANRRFLGVYK